MAVAMEAAEAVVAAGEAGQEAAPSVIATLVIATQATMIPEVSLNCRQLRFKNNQITNKFMNCETQKFRVPGSQELFVF